MDILNAKKNAIINVLGWLLPTLVFVAITPVMVKHLGTEGFGIIAIIQILTGYMTILNFGFSEAITKHVAENYQNNQEHAFRIMWAGLSLFTIAGVIGSLIIFLLSRPLVFDILSVPVELREDTLIALRIGSLVFFLQMISEYYRGVSIGCNEFLIPNVTKLIRVALSAGFIWYALVHDGGLVEVMLASLAGLSIGLIINIIWLHTSISLKWITYKGYGIISELLHFGKHIFISRITNLLSSKLSQLALGSLSNMSNVALYEIPTRAVTAGAAILNQAMQIFLPGFSAMDKVKDFNRISNIYFSVISIQLFITTPLFLVASLEGNTVLEIWINSEFSESSGEILNIILITYYLSMLTNLPSLVAMSFNHPNIISRYGIISIGISVISVFPLVHYLDLTGAALVLLLTQITAIPFIYEVTLKALRKNVFVIFRIIVFKHIILSMLLYVTYEYILKPSSFYHPAYSLILPIIYYAIASASNAITKTEKQKITTLIFKWN